MSEKPSEQIRASEDRLQPTTGTDGLPLPPSLPIPQLQGEGTAPGLLTCECGKCALKFQVQAEALGTTRPCPECGQPVAVLKPAKSIWPRWYEWAIMALLALITLYESQRQLGQSTSSSFRIVGTSIGGTVPGER